MVSVRVWLWLGLGLGLWLVYLIELHDDRWTPILKGVWVKCVWCV